MVHVLLYIPNLIDYGRVLALVAAVLVYLSHPALFLVLYIVAALLDALDGKAARHFKQTSDFGMMFDMVIDRASFAAICIIDALLWPQFALYFLLLMAFDNLGHLPLVACSLICGKGTHKGKGEDINWVIQVYYNFPGALFALCFCSEGFVVCSYLSYFYTFTDVLHYAHIAAFLLLGFGLVLKQIVNVVQFTDSVAKLMSEDSSDKRD